jgi:hypothetical protein
MRMIILVLVLGVVVACDPHRPRPDAGAFCGGFAGTPCAATEFCDYDDNSCGLADQTGICRPRPEVCTLIFDPVCACDGLVYPNECTANSEGSDLNAQGTCEVPTGMFTCGFKQCDLQTQYCLHEPRRSGPDTFTCAALPACPSTPATCACLASERCGNACSGNGSVGLRLTCE